MSSLFNPSLYETISLISSGPQNAPLSKFNYQKSRLDNMQVIQQRLSVFYITVFGLVEMVLFANVVVPVHAFGQETMPAVMMFCNRPQDSQPVGKL
jgi:hypothetical protein